MPSGRNSLVHDFVVVNPGNEKQTLPSDEELVQRGRRLVSVVESRDRWRSVQLPSETGE